MALVGKASPVVDLGRLDSLFVESDICRLDAQFGPSIHHNNLCPKGVLGEAGGNHGAQRSHIWLVDVAVKYRTTLCRV